LTFAVLLAAGLDGIEKKYKLPDQMEKNLYHLSDTERQKLGIESLPGSLGEAIALAEQSELVRKTLGDHTFNRFIDAKKREWEEYRIQVTEYELKKYLPVL
jgi:glutamine synthetase